MHAENSFIMDKLFDFVKVCGLESHPLNYLLKCDYCFSSHFLRVRVNHGSVGLVYMMFCWKRVI